MTQDIIKILFCVTFMLRLFTIKRSKKF